MNEIEKIEAEEMLQGKMLPKVNLDTAPRALSGILELPRIVRWRLANGLGFPTDESKAEYKNASSFVQSHMLRDALRAYDAWKKAQRAAQRAAKLGHKNTEETAT
jgi:hypothetical protein